MIGIFFKSHREEFQKKSIEKKSIGEKIFEHRKKEIEKKIEHLTAYLNNVKKTIAEKEKNNKYLKAYLSEQNIDTEVKYESEINIFITGLTIEDEHKIFLRDIEFKEYKERTLREYEANRAYIRKLEEEITSLKNIKFLNLEEEIELERKLRGIDNGYFVRPKPRISRCGLSGFFVRQEGI